MSRHVSVLMVLLAAAAAGAEYPEPASFDSGNENLIGLTFTADGRVAFWTGWDGRWGTDPTSRKTIYMSQWGDGRWSDPLPAPFSGKFNDDDPFASPDGQWVYFVSDRPDGDAKTHSDADIWRYPMDGKRQPERLPVNSGADEYSPVVTASGTLYFASARQDGFGQGDLYRAAAGADGFAVPEILGAAVNSPDGEWNIWVSEDETDMLFEASSRPTNVSIPGDLYYSRRSASGWTPAVAVTSLNDEGSNLMPRLHPDGVSLYYASAPIGAHAETKRINWPRLRQQLRTEFSLPLLVANRSSHEVIELDLGNASVTHRFPVGDGPHLLSNVSRGRVLATGYGEFPRPHERPVSTRPPFETSLNSRVTFIDAAKATVIWNQRIGQCSRPHASWIVGDRGFVTCEDESRVAELDLQTGNVVRSFETRQKGSHVLVFEPESNTLAVSNTDAGSVTLIDIDSGTTRIVELGAGSEGSIVLDGHVWVANAIEGSISVVEPNAGLVVETIESVCGFPIAMSADNIGKVWVACFGSSELVAIGRDDYREHRRIGTDAQPLNIILHPERQLAYLSLPRRNALAEIELYSGRQTREIAVGIEPDGLRWAH